MNTWDYLERLRAANDNCSDYRLFKILEIAQSAMTRYRAGREMDDDVAIRVAKLLGLPPMRVVADVKAARAEAEGQTVLVDFWREAARAVGGVVKPLHRKDAGAMPAVAETRVKRSARGRLRPEDQGMKRMAMGAMVAEDGIEPPTRGFSKVESGRPFPPDRRRRRLRRLPRRPIPARA